MNSYLQSVVTNSVNIGYSQFHRGTAEGHISEFLPAVPLSNHLAQQTRQAPQQAAQQTVQQASQHAVQQSQSTASTSATQRIKRSPINEFNLCDFGIDLGTLLQAIGPTFDSLALDIYEKRRQEVVFLKSRFPEHLPVLNAFFLDYMSSKAKLSDLSDLISALSGGELFALERVGAVRHRSIAKFDVSFHEQVGTVVKLERVSAAGFVQKTSKNADFRALPRYFEEASEQVAGNSAVQKLLRSVASKVKEQHEEPLHSLEITLHQVIVSVDAETPFILPDGIHQDGADYIVSAIPVIMTGVVAPLSTVYDAHLQPMLETRLGIGQGLLHDDRHYWHSVSTLFSSGAAGKRGTLGLDVQVKK